MRQAVRSIYGLRARCVKLEESIERNARALNRSEQFAGQVAKVYGSDRPLEDLDVWELSERRAGLAGLAQRLLEAQVILKADSGDHATQLRALLEEPELVELEGGRTVACYPVTIPVAVTITQRQEILRRAVVCIGVAEGSQDYVADRHRLENVRTWQRAAIVYEATLPPGSTFRLPLDPPWLARKVSGAVAWLDGSNRWDRQFWRTWALCTWVWRLLDRLVPGRGLSKLTGVPSAWCWTISVTDELSICRGNLAANDERARALPRLSHSGEASDWSWTAFSAAMADQRHLFPKSFIHDHSMLAMLTDFSITAARRKKEDEEREKKRPKGKADRPRGGKRRSGVRR